jgi:hypothetical protein
LLCDILKPVGFHIEGIHGLCCAFFTAPFFGNCVALRMRGKDGGSSAEYDSDGITPAYAGKRSLCLLPQVQAQDHPRLCGEKAIIISPIFLMSGSPPRMRGKVTYSAVAKYHCNR